MRTLVLSALACILLTGCVGKFLDIRKQVREGYPNCLRHNSIEHCDNWREAGLQNSWSRLLDGGGGGLNSGTGVPIQVYIVN